MPDERVLEDFGESVVANRVLRGDYTKLIPNEGGLLNTKEPVGESGKFHIDSTEILKAPHQSTLSRRNNITRRGFILRPFDLDIGYHVPCGRKCADRLQTNRCSLGMRYNIRPHCSQMKRQTLMTEFIEVSNSHTLTSRSQ